MLASLDSRSYNRCVLRDANIIMEDVLQPMAFPWQHRVVPVARNIPCDIDEMPEVLTAEDGSHAPFRNGPLGFGRFDVGQLRRGASTARLVNSHDMVCSAARRSDDPGVIEFAAMTFPPNSPEDLCSDFENKEREMDRALSRLPHTNSAMQTLEVDDSATRGELSVRCFEQVQSNKRRKVEQSRACKHTQHVSVKVNSSSSRSSLFSSVPINGSRCDPERGPLLLAATLPSEVQNGRFLSTTRAASIAQKLGTYNCRHGLGPTNPSGKNSNRITVGRTRLVWTEKSPSDQPQRVFFTSLLTGDRIEGGAQKRPREIRVGVKVNCHLLKEGPTAKHIPDFQGRSLSNTNDDIDEAFDSTFGESYTVESRLQCALDSGQLLRNLSRVSKEANIYGFQIANDPSLALRHEPPRIECVPDNNGLISVLCSKPGTLSLTGSIHDFLNDARRGESPMCTVCWSTTSIDLVHVCQTCGVSVHLGCCSDTGEKVAIDSNEKTKTEGFRWTCTGCYKFGDRSLGQPSGEESNPRNRTSKRESRLPLRLKDSHVEALCPKRTESTSVIDRGMKCALCPYSGGAMSSFKKDGETIWIHEVCRIWSGETSASKSSCTFDLGDTPTSQVCALCGIGGSRCSLEDDRRSPVSGKTVCAWPLNRTRTCEALVKCAAARCQVKFHPMCAIIVSKLRDESVDLESGDITKAGESGGDGNSTTSLVADNSVDYAKMEDFQFCKEYSLTALNCLSIEGRMGKDPGGKCFNLLPIAFCGIHNPKREPSLYGIYPGGINLDSKSMRIPPLNYSEQ
jgi:hypothetical protein